MPCCRGPGTEIHNETDVKNGWIRAKSPLRISFAGGGTDIREWYELHGGAVLSSTIDKSATVTLRPRPDSRLRIRSLDLKWAVDYHLKEEPTYDGILDLAKAAIAHFDVDKGFDIDIRSDAPAGGGLGGSSAVTSALIGALASYTDTQLSRTEMAELNYKIERIDLKISGGKQDQYATTFGGFNHIVFRDDGVAVAPLDVDANTLRDLETHLLLCYVGQVRSNTGLIDKQLDLLKDGRKATVEGMHRIQADVERMKDALASEDLERFGRILHEAFVHKKMMNPEVTKGTVVDELYEVAREQGALGGKLVGAGGGGHLVLYVPTSKQHLVRHAVEAVGGVFVECAFSASGLQVWKSPWR